MDNFFEIGDRVRFMETGRYYEATVMEIKDGKIKVSWDIDGPDHDWELNDFHDEFNFEPINFEEASALWGELASSAVEYSEPSDREFEADVALWSDVVYKP